ncbi:MAG: hypothetical protein GF350_05715 [Chitinivibrionales bacterium]|nr:hypothetical protein [Chitinivibrionales bacterium]
MFCKKTGSIAKIKAMDFPGMVFVLHIYNNIEPTSIIQDIENNVKSYINRLKHTLSGKAKADNFAKQAHSDGRMAAKAK